MPAEPCLPQMSWRRRQSQAKPGRMRQCGPGMTRFPLGNSHTPPTPSYTFFHVRPLQGVPDLVLCVLRKRIQVGPGEKRQERLSEGAGEGGREPGVCKQHPVGKGVLCPQRSPSRMDWRGRRGGSWQGHLQEAKAPFPLYKTPSGTWFALEK